MSYPVLREDMDVVSVRFRPVDRVSMLVQSAVPSVLRLHLNTGMDSGGSLTVSLQANQVPLSGSTPWPGSAPGSHLAGLRDAVQVVLR